MNDIIALNLSQLRGTSTLRDQKLLQVQQPPSKGIYQGYDATTERHLVKTDDQGIVHGLLESTGAAFVGQEVSISLTNGGIPRFFVTPA